MPEGCKSYGHNDDDAVVINHIKHEAAESDEEPVEGDESVEPELIGRSDKDGDDEES